MDALELMRAADRLTGVHPGMSYAEIRARLDSITPERLLAVYLCAEYRNTRDSEVRAGIVTRLNTLAREHAWVSTYVNRELARRVSITRQTVGGRPRTHASDEIRKREAQRAYRERRKREEMGQ